MKIGVNLNINVSNIDKSKLVAGKKGTYLNATVFIDTDKEDQYGNNGMVTMSQSKEERAAKEKSTILGNAKVFWSDGSSSHEPAQSTQQAQNDFDGDDLPF